jgi:hypothetical protein
LKTQDNFFSMMAFFSPQHRQKVRLLKSLDKLDENFFVLFHGLSLSIGRFLESTITRVMAARSENYRQHVSQYNTRAPSYERACLAKLA